MVVKATDPVTDTTYDFSDPSGMIRKVLMMVAGLTATLMIVGVVLNQVGPAVGGFISNISGGLLNPGGASGGITFDGAP